MPHDSSLPENPIVERLLGKLEHEVGGKPIHISLPYKDTGLYAVQLDQVAI